MDSVRFGRVLGIGARLAAQTAARTLVSAAHAAAAPNPNAPTARTTPPSQPAPRPPASRPEAPPVPQTRPANPRVSPRGVAEGSRRFGQAVWKPVVKLSGVLWLELTGVFFGLFALSAGVAAWKLRQDAHGAPITGPALTHLELAVGVALVFAYFSASSFLRASRRGRRP